MGLPNSFYDQIQFNSEHFVTELLPDKFLFFLLWSEGYNKMEDIDKLVINCDNSEDRDENKIYINFHLSNSSIKVGEFGLYDKTGANSFSITYKRLFNKRFVNKKFLELIQVYDDISNGKAKSLQLEVLLKKQISDLFNSSYKPQLELKSELQHKILSSVTAILNKSESDKMIAYYKQQKKIPVSSSELARILHGMFFINANVEFSNRLLEYNYHPDGIGLDHPFEKYHLGKVVLDSYVKYTDVVAKVRHILIPEIEISFRSKVDYILLESKQDMKSNISEILIPLTNNTQANFSSYSCNGVNVQFPSCIFAYTLQLIKNRIELLYKIQNSNNYISVNIEYGKEIPFKVDLYYSLDESGNLIFVDEEFPHKITSTHSVKTKVFNSGNTIRIETEESALIKIEDYYHEYIKAILERKINNVLDVFLPVIYERQIELS